MRAEGDRGDEPEDDIDLPPLAGHDDEEQEQEHELDQELLDQLGDDSGGLDDSAAEIDPGVSVDELDALGGDDDDAEVDVGPLDEGIEDDDARSLTDDARPENEGDHDGFDIDEGTDGDDGGAEGTSEDPADEVDEGALPELDADAEGEGNDEDALAALLLAEAGGAEPRWAAARWAQLEGAGAAVPCGAVAVAAGRVAAAGEVLLLVEEGAHAARKLAFGAGATAVALSDDALLAATARGQLLLCRDGGGTATSLAGFRAGARSGASIELAAAPGRFWIRAAGELHCLISPDAPLTPVLSRGVLAATASGGVLIAIVETESSASIQRLRGDDEGWQSTPLDRAPLRAGAPLSIAASAGGRCLAITDGASALVSRDGGASFVSADLGRVLAVAFAGDGADAPLLALTARQGGEVAYLVELPRGGDPARLAEIAGAAGGDGEAESRAAMAWDASREVAWIACRAGLIALGRHRRH